MQNIKKELRDFLLDSAKTIQEVLFIEDEFHPIWSDSLEILRLADKQILQPIGAIPNEHILAFIGVHAKTAITGKRDNLGFLISNFRILTQTDFSVIGTAENAQIDLFLRTQSLEEICSKVWNDFTIKNKLSIGQEQLLALNNALRSVVGIVLPLLQKLDYLPDEIKKSSNIDERIRDLGLQGKL